MYRIALCDDNKDFLYIERKIIHEYFSSVGEQCTCDLYTSGVDLISVDNNLSDYDLFLLDYEMDDMNGFATANRIHDIYPQSKIAFSTVFYDFTREGYKHHAVRYLVKGEESFKDDLCECLHYLMSLSEKPTLFTFNFIEGEVTIDEKDLIYVESKGHYLYFYVNNNNRKWGSSKYSIRKSLNDVESELGNHFLRVHQRYLVNMRYVTGILKEMVRVKTGIDNIVLLPIARNRYSDVTQRYCLYKGGN